MAWSIYIFKFIYLLNSTTKTRSDFLRIVALKLYKHVNHGVAYLKKYATSTDDIDTDDVSAAPTQSTDPVIAKAIKELRSCYPLQATEKLTLITKLIFNVIFLSGWIFYIWAFVTDIELLYRSYGCVCIWTIYRMPYIKIRISKNNSVQF